MRLDLFLKASRLVLRRSIAQQLCDAGRVSVNGMSAKPSKAIKIGDMIEILRGESLTRVRVLEIPAAKQVSKQVAGSLVQVQKQEKVRDPLLP